jgi:polyhydroxybutyrate depolymerase
VLAPGDSPRTVLVGSTTRSYVLHVPPGYDGTTPVPLVLDFHGVGKSGADELAESPYPGVLDPENVIMAFPDGMRGPAGTAWNVGPCCVAGVDDVAFSRALVAQVQDMACIDATRIYAVGILTGGGMAHYLACRAADLFAAVAPAGFDLLEENIDDCNPQRPISVISFRGTAEVRVPYAGGPSALVPGMPITFLGAQPTFEKWAEIDGCSGAASAPDPNGCSNYTGCDGGVDVVLCTQDGGRELPGDASIAWPLLKRHTL